MDDQRRSLIITAVVTLLILALIVGLVLFLVRFVQNRPKTQTNSTTISSSASPIANRSAAPGFTGSSPKPGTSGSTSVSLNIYAGDGFSIKYPKSWGLLTCNNSENFELDPVSSADQLKYPCDRAIKPVTVLVGDAEQCQGENITLGGKQIVKSKINGDNGDIDYKWCTKTTPSLNITHRVSKTPSRATSVQDYSMQIEQIISSFTPGS